jgi:osmoprotectant transport system substrate-binding protein
MRIHRALLVPVVVSSLVLLAAACGDDDDDDSSSEATSGTTATEATSAATDATQDTTATTAGATDTTAAGGAVAPGEGPTIVIGAQDFGESAILAEIYGQALEDAGFTVEQQALGGFREIVYTTFDSGDINFTAEYAASALEFLNDSAGEASSDVDATVEALNAQLATRGLQALDPSPAVDSNAFVVTSETAESKGLSKVSDLTDDLRLGGPADCPDNPNCIPGLMNVYGIDLSGNFTALDGGGPLTVAALDGGEIDVAILFSTNGVIADKDWVVLEDDKGLITADNIVPVVTDELVASYGDALTSLVNEISAALTTEELTELNRRFDIDKEDADAIAADWLTSKGFLG